jgi:hypothetical protein
MTKRGHHSQEWAPFNHVSFNSVNFPLRRPHVFCAIKKLDVNHSFNTRIEVKATSVTQLGMKLSMGAWDDTDCNSAEVSWLAFDEAFFTYQLKNKP